MPREPDIAEFDFVSALDFLHRCSTYEEYCIMCELHGIDIIFRRDEFDSVKGHQPSTRKPVVVDTL